jgi:hypothetical protein
MTELAPPSPSPASADEGNIVMAAMRAAEITAIDRGARIGAVKVMIRAASGSRPCEFLDLFFIGNPPLLPS